MADESLDILSTTLSEDEGEVLSVDELFIKALETMEGCQKRIKKIDLVNF